MTMVPGLSAASLQNFLAYQMVSIRIYESWLLTKISRITVYILSLVHNIDAGLSVKTASKAPLYAGIEISSIPASASSVNIVNQALLIITVYSYYLLI